MRLTIDEADELSSALWRVAISPSDVAMFGAAPSRAGMRTILLLTEQPHYAAARRQLSFDPRSVRPLNIGTGREAIMIGAIGSDSIPAVEQNVSRPTNTNGDAVFLRALPAALRPTGTALLERVREQFRGQLKFVEGSKRYVESPDNFWTVKIQPRDVSLRITVRGRPEQLVSASSLAISNDRPGYSTFKLASIKDVSSAVKIIVASNRRGR